MRYKFEQYDAAFSHVSHDHAPVIVDRESATVIRVQHHGGTIHGKHHRVLDTASEARPG